MCRLRWFGLLAVLPVFAADLLLVGHKRADSVGLYDPNTGKIIATVPAGLKPHELALSADCRLAYVTNYGVDSYTDKSPGANTITIIDVRERRQAGTISLGRFRRPHGIERGDSGKLYVTCDFPGSLVIVDPVKREVVHGIELKQELPHMVAVMPGESRAYVTNSGSGSVSVVDLRERRVLKNIAIGGEPMGMALSRDHRKLFAVTRTGNSVAVIDTVKNDVVSKLDLPGQPSRAILTPDGKGVLVSLSQSGEVVLIGTDAKAVLKRIQVGSSPEGMGLDPGGVFAYASAQGDNKVIKFSLKDWTKVLEIPTAERPDPMAFVPASR